VALGLGSVVLVQALQVTSLLFALPVYAWLTKQRLSRRTRPETMPAIPSLREPVARSGIRP
jgi:hypothetical protein